MEIIVCLDDHNGMSFNHRRQSRDRLLIADVCHIADGRALWMNNYSVSLFTEADCVNTCHVCGDFLDKAPQNALCFVEDQALAPYAARFDRLVIYRWNRHYPADRYFDLSTKNWRLVETVDFVGYSHERITREVYDR